MSLKGTPCIYQGEELGQTQTKIEFDEIKILLEKNSGLWILVEMDVELP